MSANMVSSKKSISTNTGDKFEVSNLTISTCTVITNLNAKVNLGYLTRFVNIYEQNAPELDLKSGGIYNLEFYGNCARGETLVDRIKDEFNNQTTVKFKYWGFRNVNVKIFANGKLQMTGLKYENEAMEIGNLMIDIIQNTKINVLNNISELINVAKTFDFQVVYDSDKNKVFYYRKYYNRFLKNYNFDIDKIYNDYKGLSATVLDNSIDDTTSTDDKKIKSKVKCKKSSNIDTEIGIDVKKQEKEKEKEKDKKKKNIIQIKEYNFNIKRKNFIKGIHDAYSDIIEDEHKDFLKENEWYGDNEIMRTIDKLELIKTLFEKDMENVLTISKTLLDVRDNIERLGLKYQDFKFDELDEILTNINKGIYSTDENTLVDVKSEIYHFIKTYRNLLEKKINRLVIIRNIDVLICYNLEKYLETQERNTIESIDKLKNISLEDLDMLMNEITAPYNYHVSNTETVLINSDLSVNFNINLKKLSKILKKKGLFNTYEPDEHSGINLKYYYNPTNMVQGFCNCQPHCATKEKHPVCTKITILIFRPGSIIITGSRNIEQLKSAHELIIKLMEENMNSVKVEDSVDDNKHIALLNNEFRKISRKPRLFYIKRENIIMN